MERVQVFLRERGFRVFVVPEAATLCFLNGASPDDLARPECCKAFQDFVISTQMSLEDSFTRYATSCGTKSVLLCDRGIMDGSAYVDQETWNEVLREHGMDTVSAREGRYDAVFHLVTAADGAEEFYSLANNAARHESLEEARELDKKTQRAWIGHPHHVIIDNRHNRSFEKKLERLVSLLAGYVGLPSLTRRAHKFALSAVPSLDSLPNVQIFEVEKVMLVGEEAEESSSSTAGGADGEKTLYSFVRRRSQGSFSAYGLTTVKQLASGERVEMKQVISSRMYSALTNAKRDALRDVVRQRRYCFMWEKQSFHIYEYLAPHAGIFQLLCQSEGEPVLPPFIEPVMIETGVEAHAVSSAREISLRSQSPTITLAPSP